MARILITGVSGLLGINLALEAAEMHEVIGVLHDRPLYKIGFQTVQADLLALDSPPRLLDETQPDWVIHCAAIADLDACERQPKLAQCLNVELPSQFAKETSRRGIQLLHISTDAVFDGRRGDYSEEDRPSPLSIYASTKLASEEAVLAANPEAIVVRPNFFGWSLSGTRSLAEFFYNHLSANKHALGLTDRFSCPLLANDLAAVLLRMLDRGLHGLYHVVSADSLSKYDFGVALAQRFGLDHNLIDAITSKEMGYAAQRAAHLTLRTDKISHALGELMPSVSAGIEKLYRLAQEGYRERLQSMAGQPTNVLISA